MDCGIIQSKLCDFEKGVTSLAPEPGATQM